MCAGSDPQSAYLSEGASEALRANLVLLLHLRQELAGIANRLRKVLAGTPTVRWIDSVPGFGLILSHVVASEIGDLRRFKSSRALANYVLLAPRAGDTGEPLPPGRAPLGRHLGRRGNRTLKWAFIEAAHGAIRSGGRWRAIYDRATNGGRKDRGRGVIKVARAFASTPSTRDRRRMR